MNFWLALTHGSVLIVTVVDLSSLTSVSHTLRIRSLPLFNAELSPERYRRGQSSQGVGEWANYTQRYTQTLHSNSKHWFTTSFLQWRCRKAMLGVCATLSPPQRLRWTTMGAFLMFRSLWGAKSHDSVHKSRPLKGQIFFLYFCCYGLTSTQTTYALSATGERGAMSSSCQALRPVIQLQHVKFE